MEVKALHKILLDYSKMDVDTLIELKNLIEDYPYCQTAQMLYLLNLKRLGEDTFEMCLPNTAIRVRDRQKLKEAVSAVDEILAQETTPKKSKTASQKDVQQPTTKNFQSKTISELLNLPKNDVKSITPIKLPQSTSKDDLLLEQLRQEALAKVNERLNEIRQTTMVNVDFVEKPHRQKKIVSAQELIDKAIATNPKISKVDDVSEVKTKALSHWKSKEERSLREDYEMVSETLAQLYVAQGAPAKALEIYKTLGQKFPERKSYFSQLSKQIKTNHKPKTKK